MLQTLKTIYSKPLEKSQIKSKPKLLHKHSYRMSAPLNLESGDCLENVTISYSTYGQLNADASNVIWVCHALTADANPSDWWPGLVGENDLYNPKDYFIVCANMIGSAYGSTSPLNCPIKNRYDKFPHISIRDNVIAFEELRQFLGIGKIHTLMGGSMGGQQAMEWAIKDTNICKNLILLATNAAMSPWAVALNQSQRLAIEADESWGLSDENAAQSGLKAARSVALISYRNNLAYNSTQSDEFEFGKTLKAASYQNYQGEKLVNRFNAYSYYALTKTMDSHDVGRNRGGITKALESIKANTLVVGVSSDMLFPIEDSQELAKDIKNCELITIDSSYGHDGFLIETEKISSVIQEFYEKQSMSNSPQNIGMFGYGCVGQGVYNLMQKSKTPNQIKSIIIKNEFKARKSGHELITTDQYRVFQDPEIKTVIEVINGCNHAFNLAKIAKDKDKNFISANKKMISHNLAEIISWNKKEQSILLYEAAVAGSIPIIRNLDTYFDCDDTNKIRAIVNGSSNYILTQMIKNNLSYQESLNLAQNSGYAEIDPTDDVRGFDSKYKSVILAAHGFGLLCHPNEVFNFGIQSIQISDIEFAQANNLTIKLIATIKRESNNSVQITVIPEFIEDQHELAQVDDENNIVLVNNQDTDFIFKGAGAGSIATGSAILSDLKAINSNYRYQYQIDDNLTINNDFLIKVYINKSNLNQNLTGNILSETKDYIIFEMNYQNLIALDLTEVFVALIK
ncbi:MAG: homoserine O-acetyltransferase [Marinicellaceae bacterium]